MNNFSTVVEQPKNEEMEQEILMLPLHTPEELQISLDKKEIVFSNTLEVFLLLFHFFHFFLQKVNSSTHVEFIITNKSKKEEEFKIFYVPTNDSHLCKIDPNMFLFFTFKISHTYFFFSILVSLSNGENKTVKLSLSMCCTARLDTKIEFVVKGIGHFSIPLKAESAPSSYLSLDELQLGKVIGSGGFLYLFIYFLVTILTVISIFTINRFGKVLIGKYRGETVAVKQIMVANADSIIKQIENEIMVMTKLRSPNIVSFYGEVV